VEDADYGYYYAAKRAGKPLADGTQTHSIRVTAVIFPTGRIIPAPGSFHYYLLEVPQDDENTATYMICHGLERADHDAVVEIMGLHDSRFWNEEDCVFRATWAEHMWQDRARMDAGQSFAGFSGIEQEDMVLALSMGPIVDRSREHLVPADRAVVHLRRRLLESVRRVEAGGDPIGISITDYSKVAPLIDTTLPTSARWQDLLPHNAVQAEIAAE
jgi:phthalate 4,5-dioxygenase oxygenase subunit